ncbi:hypothetical protein Hanom_Chr16g01416291 [Helianthus anomalus]
MFSKLQKVNLLMVGEYTELLVLNCCIYIKILQDIKLPVLYRSLTDIRYFTAA